MMKINGNEPCPCGSGKKYKYCCLNSPQSARPSSQELAEEIRNYAEDNQVTSIDELNEYASQIMRDNNQRGLVDFCGLSAEQMSQLLYQPFDSPKLVHFRSPHDAVPDARALTLFIALANEIGKDGLKATATGNLPLGICKALANEFKSKSSDPIQYRIGGIRSEPDFDALHCIRLVSTLAGLIRKTKGKFWLTKRAQELLAAENHGEIYFLLLQFYATKFNWAYRDGYPEAIIIQRSFLFTLFLLRNYGATPRPQRFYEDKFLTAFPMALDEMLDTPYSDSESQARRCYFIRSIEDFAHFFGLVELKRVKNDSLDRTFTVMKSELLDSLVTFNH